MTDVDDGYDRYYAERLWQLLPAMYRTTDTDQYGVPGPLRELVNRIGAQIAVTRRSIDRMWADQAVETCDDWVVPYIGDLLGVSLVPGLDPPGTRADVGKTVHYRRRKGTVAILEEIATDVTGWQARVVEAFRQLARSAHGLDPAIGLPPAQASGTVGSGAAPVDLRQIQGLVGPLTGTPAAAWPTCAHRMARRWPGRRSPSPPAPPTSAPATAAPAGTASPSCWSFCGGCPVTPCPGEPRSP